MRQVARLFFCAERSKNFFNSLRVPRSGTSMRNPLQSTQRRSCGWARMQGRFPEGGLMSLAVSRMCKSRFAELYPLIPLYPQLRRKAACSGFRIEVYLRHTLWAVPLYEPSVIKRRQEAGFVIHNSLAKGQEVERPARQHHPSNS